VREGRGNTHRGKLSRGSAKEDAKKSGPVLGETKVTQEITFVFRKETRRSTKKEL